MELELTFTQEQKLKRLANRFKCDPALVAEAADGLEPYADGWGWTKNLDIDLFNDNSFHIIFEKVLGPYTPSVQTAGNHHFSGVQQSDAHYYIDPMWELGWTLVEEILWDRWQAAIFTFKKSQQTPCGREAGVK